MLPKFLLKLFSIFLAEQRGNRGFTDSDKSKGGVSK